MCPPQLLEHLVKMSKMVREKNTFWWRRFILHWKNVNNSTFSWNIFIQRKKTLLRNNCTQNTRIVATIIGTTAFNTLYNLPLPIKQQWDFPYEIRFENTEQGIWTFETILLYRISTDHPGSTLTQPQVSSQGTELAMIEAWFCGRVTIFVLIWTYASYHCPAGRSSNTPVSVSWQKLSEFHLKCSGTLRNPWCHVPNKV